jgi:hypothetical protein
MVKPHYLAQIAATLLIYSSFLGCNDPSLSEFGVGAEDNELGKSLFSPTDLEESKSDSVSGKKGLSTSVDSGSTQVWEVRNQWTDIDTEDALKEGMAWSKESGLDWNQKYSLWIRKMDKISAYTYGDTFQLITPFNKTLPAPSIECAETSLFLRATFASWYQLPFFVEAKDRNRKRVFLGHFGFLTELGKYSSTPNFKTAYRDYSDQYTLDAEWPKDTKLRKRKLGGSEDDQQPFISADAHAGTYFDEIFLNKRVGYFMVYLLSYFGSINLADPSNTFNIKPESTREGDTLLHRWRRRGIGHTLVVKHVEHLTANKMEIDLVSGSMPRRQPQWEDSASSKYSLTVQKAGGSEDSYDEVPFSRLGGGMKRWRVAQVVSGRWTNMVPTSDQSHFISARDYDQISQRPQKFEELLAELTPEVQRESILERIISQRNHLRRYPASCSARLKREDAFKELYALEKEHFESDATDVDLNYRKLEDYIFAPLVYEESKTCCWNKSNEEMYAIIMDYAHRELEAAEFDNLCMAPTVFKSYEDGYTLWADHANTLEMGSKWKPWSEDETCPQRDAREDVTVDSWSGLYCIESELP